MSPRPLAGTPREGRELPPYSGGQRRAGKSPGRTSSAHAPPGRLRRNEGESKVSEVECACVLPWGGATSADYSRCWGGTRAWRGGVCRLARTRPVRSRRVCVRALRVCVWSQFPPSATLPDLGERAVPLFGFGVPSFLNLHSSRSARTPVRAPDSQAQVRRAQRASQLSRFPRPPLPRAVRPLGFHSSGVLPAAALPAPIPSKLPWPHPYSTRVYP